MSSLLARKGGAWFLALSSSCGASARRRRAHLRRFDLCVPRHPAKNFAPDAKSARPYGGKSLTPKEIVMLPPSQELCIGRYRRSSGSTAGSPKRAYQISAQLGCGPDN